MDKCHSNLNNQINVLKWTQHFKNLVNSGLQSIDEGFEKRVLTYIEQNKNTTFNYLDYIIKESEVMKHIAKLKNERLVVWMA